MSAAHQRCIDRVRADILESKRRRHNLRHIWAGLFENTLAGLRGSPHRVCHLHPGLHVPQVDIFVYIFIS